MICMARSKESSNLPAKVYWQCQVEGLFRAAWNFWGVYVWIWRRWFCWYYCGAGEAQRTDFRDRVVGALRNGWRSADAPCSMAEAFDVRHRGEVILGIGRILPRSVCSVSETERGRCAEAGISILMLPATRPRAYGSALAAPVEMAECQSRSFTAIQLSRGFFSPRC